MNQQFDGEEQYHIALHQLPSGERPRERFLQVGERAVGNAELLAIILRTGHGQENVLRLAERLLARFGGLPGLARASVAELTDVRGIGEVKAIEVKAALELGRRLVTVSAENRPKITCPADAANLLMTEMMYLEQEHLRVLLLDTRNHVLSSPTISIGSLNSAVVGMRELFRAALRENSAGLIVAHNHPSGDPSPSTEDIRTTKEMIQAGKLLGVAVLDHLIIGRGRFVSLKEQGHF